MENGKKESSYEGGRARGEVARERGEARQKQERDMDRERGRIIDEREGSILGMRKARKK